MSRTARRACGGMVLVGLGLTAGFVTLGERRRATAQPQPPPPQMPAPTALGNFPPPNQPPMLPALPVVPDISPPPTNAPPPLPQPSNAPPLLPALPPVGDSSPPQLTPPALPAVESSKPALPPAAFTAAMPLPTDRPPRADPPPPPAKPALERVQVAVAGPAGLTVSWRTGDGPFPAPPRVAPFRADLPAGPAVRLKLGSVPGYRGNFYPTLEVRVPEANTLALAYLQHNAVPVGWTAAELALAADGQLVVKAVYLPRPASGPATGEQPAARPAEVSSAQMGPQADVVAEAGRRGWVLAVVRLGDIDLEPAPPAPPEPPAAEARGG